MLTGLLLRAGMLQARLHWRRLERLARDPGAAQEAVLRRLMAMNRDTRFGRDHHFGEIRSRRDFEARVPVQSYESLQPYIDEQRRTGEPALTVESPAFYAQTSGTTGHPKYIPVTPSMLAMNRREQALFSYLQFRACPEAFAGKAFGIMGAAVEGRLDTGHVVGSVSGHLYQSLPRIVRARFVVPPDVLAIADYDLKYTTILHLALAEPAITYLGSPNPTTFLRLLDVLNTRRGTFLDSLARTNRERADALRRLPELTFANVWPGIRLVTTWTGGSCGIALDAVREKLPAAAKVMELGYQSTECRGTIALTAETPDGLPPLDHHLFEFVEASQWDRGTPAFQGLEDLEAGKRYYVLFTTAAGLCRYFMNDLIEVGGFFQATPLIRFVQKGKGVTNLTGEKLYEAQAIQAVHDVSRRRGLTPTFFVLVAEESSMRYSLFIESDDRGMLDAAVLASDVDTRLGELNIEYHAKRKSGRLGPLKTVWLAHGAAEAYKAACVRAGQREIQFKPPALQSRKSLVVAFEDFATS